MATPVKTTLNDTTSFLSVYSNTGSFLYKNVEVPEIYISTIGRVVYFKEANEFPGVPIFTISSSGNFLIENSTLLAVKNHGAITLQSVKSSITEYWSILNGYIGNLNFSTQQVVTNSVPVYLSSVSQAFVDLRTQSKVVVLPRIQSISQYSSSALFVSIKDVYGYAGTSSLFISTTYPDTLEMSSINNSLRLNSNFASMDLVANPELNKWNIVNYYTGTLVLRP